ncbi:hypothetical protein E1264_30025 [Actinomadura sp. KC216]|uniref:hypothetical protein n=1 Tax=Actinomadura sp. KC216 TaxID=2530370 RepID=UPI001044A2B4|nr:hypothetical protein [Actinomadura sp. KC216]TDB83046.1 hypothetical protein E1264_30025 [Actinomadura sp. KC216]
MWFAKRGDRAADRDRARSAARLGPAERAADLVVGALGSWAGAGMVVVLVVAAATAAARDDHRAGPVAVVALAVSARALLEVALVLVAVRRHDDNAAGHARAGVDAARRSAALAEEHTRELERLRAEVARLAARVETAGHASRRAAPSGGPDDDQGGGRAVLGWRP